MQQQEYRHQLQVPQQVDLLLVTISLSPQEGENLEDIKRYD
jgi:hypothetical protein